MSPFLVSLLCLVLSFLQTTQALPSHQSYSTSNATYYNSASTPGADPYTFFDSKSGLYWAFSTEGQDEGYLFAIYNSPDLVSWSKVPGGAMKACQNAGQENQSGEMCWARDWNWAPEVYHNEKTGNYFLFYTGRLRKDLTADWFRYSGFEEPSKLGLAVSRSPSGPFKEIKSEPIDYLPFDPDYHDVNLIMRKNQMKPPTTRAEGERAPKGTYIPAIDPNIYFSEDGKIYLYYSRNAYRNWVWDTHGLNKYIEESNILGVELKRDWWDDPNASTMPSIIDSEKDRFSQTSNPLPSNISSYNGTGSTIKEPKRKDGWKTLISYNPDPQEWENFHVNDYNKFNGTRKDRRWSEGSNLISRSGKGYLMTYSCNNFEAANYGVGYATSPNPLGPFKKSNDNPILSQKPVSEGNPAAFSVGHGSIVATFPESQRERVKLDDAQFVTHETPQSSELFYVHHGRNSTNSNRYLYTTRMTLDRGLNLSMDLETDDQEIARGTSPYDLKLKIQHQSQPQPSPNSCLDLCHGPGFEVEVYSSSGAKFDLAFPHHRIMAEVEPQELGDAKVELGTGKVEVKMRSGSGKGKKGGRVIVRYQRQSVDGSWHSIEQDSKAKGRREIVGLEKRLCRC